MSPKNQDRVLSVKDVLLSLSPVTNVALPLVLQLLEQLSLWPISPALSEIARDEVQFMFEQRVLQMIDVAVKVGLVELVLEWLRPRITLEPLATVGTATTVQDQAKFSRLMAGSVMATYSSRCPLPLTPACWGAFLETCMRAQRPGAALIVFQEMTTRQVPVTSVGFALMDMARLNAVTTSMIGSGSQQSISFSSSSNLTTAAFLMPATNQPHGNINIASGNRKMRLSGVRAPPL